MPTTALQLLQHQFDSMVERLIDTMDGGMSASTPPDLTTTSSQICIELETLRTKLPDLWIPISEDRRIFADDHAALCRFAAKNHHSFSYLLHPATMKLDRSGRITMLTILDSPVKDLTPLLDLPELRELDCNFRLIESESQLSAFTALTTLHLTQCEIRDLTCLSPLRNLESLCLSENGLTDLNGLRPLVNLKQLTLDNNEIRNIAALGALTELESLNLSYNKIPSATALAPCIRLKELNLAGNRIAGIDSLAPSTSLISLELADNPIHSLSFRTHFPNLWRLSGRDL